ncbi:MAG: hypothetical protein V1781_08325 [Bacteroidota bacterium]
MKKLILIIVLFLTFGFWTSNSSAQNTFTQADRDRLIRMEAILEQHDKRFEQIDKRFEELRADMNARFESVDKRSEELRADMNNRFEQTNTYIGWLIALFCAITASTIGFAIWDRRTMVRPFETKVKEVESSIENIRSLIEDQIKKTSQSIHVWRELAKTDNKIAEALRTYSLL